VAIAKKNHIPVIASGESIGQVASQTLESLVAINEVTNMPIIRPLATYDKVDIIKIANEIGTYDISIRPFEDCCTIFPVKKPKTAPHLDICHEIEEKFDFTPLLEEAVTNTEIKVIREAKDL
jgi:thiamine biosynthesis protein ThiI